MPDSTSPYALEGTVAHEVAALSMDDGADFDTSPFVGKVIAGVEVTQDMADHVQTYVDYVDNAIAEGSFFWCEKKFNLMDLKPPASMFGTADAVVFDETTGVLEVIDLKFGQGVVVDVVNNPQLLYYALGAALAIEKEYPEFRGQIKVVRITIVQPRAPHADGPIRSWEVSYMDVVDFAIDLMEYARATQKPDAPLVAGTHCRFCKASAVCPALMAESVSIAQSEFDVMPDAPPRPETLPMTTLLDVLDGAPILDQWLKDVRAYVFGTLEAGVEVPGWKLVAKRANRKWKNEAEALAGMSELGIEERYSVPKIKSPAQAEGALKKLNRTRKRGDKLTLPKDLVHAPSSGYSLVRESDKREAALLGPAEFEAELDLDDLV